MIKLLIKYKSIIFYIIFGVLTTLINIFSYWFFTRIFKFDTVPGTVVAWILAVFFAYCTNRKWVFESKAVLFKDIFKETVSFFTCRIITGILDIIFMWLFVDVLKINDVFIKIISDITVIILNFIFSKFFVFKQ